MPSRSAIYADDTELFTLLEERLFTAVVGDVMDQMGLTCQFLPQPIKPLAATSKLAGRAMPVLEADAPEDASRAEGGGPLRAKPFGLMMEALDDLARGEIYVANGASMSYALWGGLMTRRAMHLGARGAILDGYCRDAGEIEALGFPVFARGLDAQDQGARGKVVDWRCRIEIAGILIAPGDLLFADREGVLVIPRAAEAEVIARAVEKAETESRVAEAIRAGMGAAEAFRKFGVM
ncbi:MAG: RraA family protein [Hyphomicrobiaceae bacterium]